MPEERLTHLSLKDGWNGALFSLGALPALAAEAPRGLEEAHESAACILAAVPSEPSWATEAALDWGQLLALAQGVYGRYQTLEEAPRGEALAPLKVAVALVEAGASPDSGIAAHDRKEWALLALVGHGMLGEHRHALNEEWLPKLKMEHPACLLAAGLSAHTWLAVASPGAGISQGPYRELAAEAAKLVYDAADASPARAEERYQEAMRAALSDPKAASFDVVLLGYAHLSLRQLEAAWRERTALSPSR